MKKYIIAVLVCASWAFVSDQVTEGVITYSTKVNLHKRIPAEQEEMKKMMPEFSISQNQLVFNAMESLFKPVLEDVNPFDRGAEAGGIRMMRMGAQNETYIDQRSDEMIQLREFMGKKYLIRKEIKRLPWKLEIETREINGYLCKKAGFTDENSREIEAWYTEDIRIPLGPDSFHGLPGLILEVRINSDETVITADKIELRTLKKNELKEPKGGQEIAESDFNDMVKEQMEKMGATQDVQGPIRIRRN